MLCVAFVAFAMAEMVWAIVTGGLGILALFGATGEKRPAVTPRRGEERLERWRNSWLCLRCGLEFVELPGGRSICESLESKTKDIRDAEGLLPAIRHYRERTGAGLAEAKAYVERL